MKKNQLQAISPIDGRYSNKCDHLREFFSEASLMHYRVKTEIKWLQYLANNSELKEIPPLSSELNTLLENIDENFSIEDALEIKGIENTINHDVKSIEYFLQSKMKEAEGGADYLPFIHFGCTSEDINNISYALMIKEAIKTERNSYLELVDGLRTQAHEWSDCAMLSRTHGQAASPTTMGKEFANVVYRLELQLEILDKIEYRAKMNGAVGNYNAHQVAYPEINWIDLSHDFITSLGLTNNPYTTQIEPHDWIAEVFHSLIRINNILMDFSKDKWLYISMGYFDQIKKDKEVGSSTMPHKINPIDFENAEGNIGIANSLLTHLASKLPISRMQRDLTDSTALRNVGSCFAYTAIALSSLKKGLSKIRINEERINEDLSTNWEILTEAIQTVLRREKTEDAYESLKKLSHGEKLDQEKLIQYISSLHLDEAVKQELINLTPESYIGFAATLAKKI